MRLLLCSTYFFFKKECQWPKPRTIGKFISYPCWFTEALRIVETNCHDLFGFRPIGIGMRLIISSLSNGYPCRFTEAIWVHNISFMLLAVMHQVILWMDWMVLMVRIHITFIVVHEAITGCGIPACSTMGIGKYGTKNALLPFILFAPICLFLSLFLHVFLTFLNLCRF